MQQKTPIILLLGLISVGLIVTPASAYLDPGTASIVFQMMIAAFFGMTFAVKMFWTKIKTFFGMKVRDESDSE